MGEVKQTNLRIDQDTAEAFRSFCIENGMNQAQGFDHIMQVMQLNKAKAVTPGRAVEIERFEKSLKDIMAAYLNSLEIYKDAEEQIREQVASELKRKDATINELREKISKLQLAVESAENKKKEAEEAEKTASERENNAISQMEAAKKNAADQEKINSMLTIQLAEAAEKLDDYDVLKCSETALKEEIAELKFKLKDATSTLVYTKDTYESQIAGLKQENEQIQVLKKSEADLKEKLADMERTLVQQTTASEAAMSKIQAEALLSQERSVMAKEREMQEQLRLADKENAKLTAQIEQLQEQISNLQKK